MESDFEMSVREFLARSPFCFRKLSEQQLSMFCTALTHDSYSHEAADMDPPRHVDSYERLEFLGDSILEFLVCEHVYLDTEVSEGPMTDYKQDKVANHMLSQRILDKGIGIDLAMRVGNGHMKGHSKSIEENMRADCFEALLAAVYLSFGMDEARRIVREVVLDRSRQGSARRYIGRCARMNCFRSYGKRGEVPKDLILVTWISS